MQQIWSKEASMATYRIYLLDPEDRVTSVEERDFESERAAAQAAEARLPGGAAAEVWREADLIFRAGAVFSPFA
jgi:hypothetical protein